MVDTPLQVVMALVDLGVIPPVEVVYLLTVEIQVGIAMEVKAGGNLLLMVDWVV